MNDTKKNTDMPAGLAELTFGTGRSMLQIDSMEKAWRLAKLRAVAKTVDADSPEALTICILYGQEVGLTPLMSMEKIALINGRPTIWGDGALALIMTNPLFEDIDERVEGTGDGRIAYCTVIRKGQSPKTSTFSVDDAKQAGLWDDRATVKRKMKYDGWYQGKKVVAGEWADLPNDAPWFKYQNRMLQMRARGFRLHDSFPDVLGGMYLREELMGPTIEHDASETPPARSGRLPEPPPPPPSDGAHHHSIFTPGFGPPPPPPDFSEDAAIIRGEPPSPPAFVDHPHVTSAQGAAVSVRFLDAAEADNLIADYESRCRDAKSEDDLDYIWGDLISPLIDGDRLDDSVLQHLQNIDDDRRGRFQLDN